MSAVSEQVAKKVHRCSWCGERVEIGESYNRYRYFSGGDAGTVKIHPECYEDMLERSRSEGGWFEWDEGQAERPARLPATPPPEILITLVPSQHHKE